MTLDDFTTVQAIQEAPLHHPDESTPVEAYAENVLRINYGHLPGQETDWFGDEVYYAGKH